MPICPDLVILVTTTDNRQKKLIALPLVHVSRVKIAQVYMYIIVQGLA